MKWITKNWITLLIISVVIIIARYLFWDKLKTYFSNGKSAATDHGNTSMPVPPVSNSTPNAPSSSTSPKVIYSGIGTPLQAIGVVNVRKEPLSGTVLNIDHVAVAGSIVGTWLATVPALPNSIDKGPWYKINLPGATFYQPQYYYVYASLVSPV